MGLVRFLLAILVVLSHLDKRLLGLNLGVSAVIVFYLFCGYSQSKLWSRLTNLKYKDAVKVYYLNRALRILPQYFFAVMLGMIIFLIGGGSYYLSASPSMFDWIQNILLVPLNYFMFTGIDHFTLVPPAWSLALEIQFYFLMPFIARLRLHHFAYLFVSSLTLFIFSQLHYLNLEYFGYRLLPGMLFVFLIGYLFYSHIGVLRVRNIISALWVISFIYLAAILAFRIAEPFNLEVLLGLLAGIPVTYIFSGKRNFLPKRVDGLLGATSYGVFLYHFFVIWALEYFSPIDYQCLWVISLSFILALIGHYCIELPMWRKLNKKISQRFNLTLGS